MSFLVHLNPNREKDGLDWRIVCEEQEWLIESVTINVPSHTECVNGGFFIAATGILTVKDKKAEINALELWDHDSP